MTVKEKLGIPPLTNGETEVTYQDHGTVIAVFIKGDNEQDVNERFWSFWNHGATSGEFHWVEGKGNGYFWTTPAKLLKALEGAALFKLLGDSDELREHDPDGWKHCVKGIKGGLLPQAKINAKVWLDSIEKKGGQLAIGTADFSDPDNFGTYSMGTIDGKGPKIRA
jgi:hypothetical protein